MGGGAATWIGYLDIVSTGWFIMGTDNLDPYCREEYIRSADLVSGAFERGKDGFSYSAL